MAEIVLSTQKLSVGYGKKLVIGGIEISVERGKILTLIGPNGAGKSTVLKTLCRQLAPLGGTVYIGKKKLVDLSDNELARNTAVLLTGKVRTEYMQCIDVVKMGRYPYTGRLGVLSKYDNEKVEEVIKKVDIESIANSDFESVSDGQRQRVLIAGAICREPQILILDEPATFLDIKYKLELMDILKKLAYEQNTAIIMSLHELDLAQRVSDKLLCIKGNRPDRFGTPEEIFTGSYIETLYDVKKGSLCEYYGTIELHRSEGEPKVFVIGGGGSGITVYRKLRRLNIPFAAGVIHENDIEYPVAMALASKLVTEKAFEQISDENYEKALEIMSKCESVICVAAKFGTMNKRCKELLQEAQRAGKLIEGAFDE